MSSTDRLNQVENDIIGMKTDLTWIKRIVIAILVILSGKTIGELAPSVVSMIGGTI